jgi:hypothetical protein
MCVNSEKVDFPETFFENSRIYVMKEKKQCLQKNYIENRMNK